MRLARALAFVAVALGAVLALGEPVAAQEKVRHVGLLLLSSPAVIWSGAIQAFEGRLKELGWTEGRNLALIRRSAEDDPERLTALAEELVSAKVETIVTQLNVVTLAARRATPTIPIVMVLGVNPIAAGLVQSLARPGGNVTGTSWDAGPEVYAKQLELLREMVPGIRRAGVLWESAVPGSSTYLAALDAAARSLGLELRYHDLRRSEDFAPAFEAMRGTGARGFVVTGGPLMMRWRNDLAELAARARLPGIWPAAVFPEAGGLMSYSPEPQQFWLRAAEYVDKVLRGARPAGLPVQQPTKYELLLNRKAARQLGLEIPPSVAVRVDRVIE